MEQKAYRDEKIGIYLRPINYKDTEQIVRWRNTDFVRNHFIFRELFTNEMHEHWMKSQVETGKVVQMIICRIADDTPCGSVYIRDIDNQNKKAEYGIFIGEKEALGCGIGTAAGRLMLRYCFEEAGLHRIYLRVLAGNERAVKSYEKVGFQKEGYLKEDVLIGGEYRDVIWMAVVEAAWRQKLEQKK